MGFKSIKYYERLFDITCVIWVKYPVCIHHVIYADHVTLNQTLMAEVDRGLQIVKDFSQ